MKGLLISLVVAASLLVPLSTPVLAATGKAVAQMTTTGAVKAVDAKLCLVTVKNMGVFLFGKKCNLSKIVAGEWVTITWTKTGNYRTASKIVPAQMLKLQEMLASHL